MMLSFLCTMLCLLVLSGLNEWELLWNFAVSSTMTHAGALFAAVVSRMKGLPRFQGNRYLDVATLSFSVDHEERSVNK